MRVSGFVQDDAHIFCTRPRSQLETKRFIDFLSNIYRDLGFPRSIRGAVFHPPRCCGAGSDRGRGTRPRPRFLAAHPRGGDRAHREPRRRRPSYRAKLEFTLHDADPAHILHCGNPPEFDFVLPRAAAIANYNRPRREKRHRPSCCTRAHALAPSSAFIGISLIEEHAGASPFWLAPRQVSWPSSSREAERTSVRMPWRQLARRGACRPGRHPPTKDQLQDSRAFRGKVRLILAVGRK